MKKARLKTKHPVLLLLCLLLLLASLVSLLILHSLSGKLEAQKEAARWQGEDDLRFSQLSCFLPVDEGISLPDIFSFRYAMLDKFHEAALDTDEASRSKTLFVDAWSTTGKAVASTNLGKGDVSVIAVGGSFFEFHPLQLISGNYITESDLMQDRVLLDEDLAWLLFGGRDLQGLELKVNGVPFVVAGVIARETDFASRAAYTAGLGMFMSYEAYHRLDEDAAITCYEVTMAEPVKNFAVNFAREKFPIGNGEILQNTDRFRTGRLLSLLRQFGKRSMQQHGILYPYWENAARCLEDWCVLLLFLTVLFALFPAIRLILLLVRTLRRGKEKLTDDLVPSWKDKAEEAVRVRQRKRWLRQHGEHEQD